MVFILFTYGLFFFLLGFALFVYPRHRTRLELAVGWQWLCAFSLIHGLTEWMDAALRLGAGPWILALRTVTMPLSFAALLVFGLFGPRARLRYRAALAGVLLSTIALVWLANPKGHSADPASRY